jgi:hypothetical protein
MGGKPTFVEKPIVNGGVGGPAGTQAAQIFKELHRFSN